MSLLQGVLKSKTVIDRPTNDDRDSDSDNDVVGVVSLPGTPGGTRPSSPTRFSSSKPIRGPLHLPTDSTKSKTDPLRKLPTEISQKIFARLPITTLAKCALVSRKWSKSQTLNYVWFQHYRKENFHDESLPPGKWTRRESKQNWRTVYLKTLKDKDPLANAYSRPYSSGSGYNSSGLNSGQQTPRERREEAWSAESSGATKPNKLEMREMYKEMGGRKARNKTKLGAETGVTRDRGGWDNGGEGW